jgi:ketosteroid isomerase-like protein
VSAPRHPDPRVARVIDFFERLTPSDVARLSEVYAEQARFKDPFNEVQGVAAIAPVFEHMFRALDGPRFVVHAAVAEGDQCLLTWDFVFRFRRFAPDREQVVRGATHIAFGPDGRIQEHRDYWDAAEELYEKLPVLGSLMRWLRRRAGS